MSTKRKDGRLQKGVTIDGVRHYVYGYTEREIAERIAELWDEKYNGIQNDITFEAYAWHWINVALVEKSLNTYISYERAMRHMIDQIGRLRVQDIKRSEIEQALNEYVDTPNTRVKMLMVTRMILGMAVDDGICKNNAAQNIRIQKPHPEERERLSKKETEAVMKADLPTVLRLLVDIFYYTGIRKGEALGLTRKSIGDGVLHITEQRQFDKQGAPYTTTLKSKNAARDVPITAELEKRIRAFAKTTDTIYLFERISTRHKFSAAWKKVEIAFLKILKPDYKTGRRGLRDVTKKQIPCRITPHVLRHNYASILHDKGIDVLVAQKLLGHSSIATTLGIYTHLDKGAETKRFDDIRDIFEAM